MATTQEMQVATLANSMITTVQTLYAISQQINQMSALWTNLGAATKLNAFPTTATLTTGALGTADVSPSTTNPIDVRVAPGSDVSRAISSTNLAGLLTYLQGVSNAIGGTAVSANGAAPQLVAVCL